MFGLTDFDIISGAIILKEDNGMVNNFLAPYIASL
jgi:hypothetical protein